MTAYSVAGHESEESDIKSANTEALMMIERIHPDEQDNYARALAVGQKVQVDKKGRIMGGRYLGGETKWDGKIAEKDELKIGADFKIIDAVGAEKADHTQIRAGLDQATRLGGDGNIAFIQKQFENAMEPKLNPKTGVLEPDAHAIEMMNQFTTANVGTLFAKLPHIYKNNNYADPTHPTDFNDVTRTVNGINPNDLTSLSGPGMRRMRDALIARANTGDSASIQSLKRLTSVFQQTTLDPSLKGRIPSEVAKAMRELADGRAGTVNPSWGIDSTLASIKQTVTTDGVVAPTTPVPTPGEIRIQHTETLARTLPAAATLAPGSAGREAFKVQLRSDPQVAQVLARGVAYGAAAPEHLQAIAELRNDPATSATPESKKAYNDIVAQIQQAYQERINETAAAFEASGRDPAVARAAASSRLAPEIVNLEPTSPAPTGTPDIRKLD